VLVDSASYSSLVKMPAWSTRPETDSRVTVDQLHSTSHLLPSRLLSGRESFGQRYTKEGVGFGVGELIRRS
jgi:hypothetical protein